MADEYLYLDTSYSLREEKYKKKLQDRIDLCQERIKSFYWPPFMNILWVKSDDELKAMINEDIENEEQIAILSILKTREDVINLIKEN